MGLRSTTETRLLDAAEELLFTRGIAATGVDAILARAGVSSATLYRGYATKDDLVAAALLRRHARWIETWDAAIEGHDDPVERLLAIFDALDAVRSDRLASRWCAFLGAASEVADSAPPVAAAVRLDTESMRERLRDLAVAVAGADAEALAEDLLCIVSGDLAMRLREPDAPTHDARRIARLLVAQHAGSPAPTR